MSTAPRHDNSGSYGPNPNDPLTEGVTARLRERVVRHIADNRARDEEGERTREFLHSTVDDTFPAQYRGTCVECNEAIEVGEMIRRAGRRHAHGGSCPVDARLDELAPKPGETRCGRCFCYHTGEC